MRYRARRAALTLIELLIVIGIIATLAAIAAVSFPRFAQHETLSRGADMLQGWLLNAKIRAKRDGVPTGIRLVKAPGGFHEVRLIQQRPDFVKGRYLRTADQKTAEFELPSGLIFTGTLPDEDEPLVSENDYLELAHSRLLRRIDGVSGYKLTIGSDSPPIPLGDYNSQIETNYRIIRKPGRIPNEPPLYLPGEVNRDTGMWEGVRINPVLSRDSTGSPFNPSDDFDIMFGSSGAIVRAGARLSSSGIAGNSQIIFWLEDTANGRPTLICVQPRTGFIAAHPVNTDPAIGDSYAFTKDSRSSGM